MSKTLQKSSNKTLKSGKMIIEQLEKIFQKSSNNFYYKEGVEQFEKILAKNKNFFDEKSLCRLGLLYDHLAMYKKSRERKLLEEKAISIYKCVLKKVPNSYRATWGIGRVWWHRKSRHALRYAFRANKFAREAHLKKGIGINTQTIGLVYEFLGDYKNAEKWLIQGMKEEPKEWGVYLNLIIFYRLINKLTKSKKMGEKLKKLFMHESKEFKNTAWGKKVQEIIEKAGKSLEEIKSTTPH